MRLGHEKVEPWHTNSCNCHAKWSLQSKACVTWNLQPLHGFCVGGFKHRHRKARNPCACHAKRIVSDRLQIHYACHGFGTPHELLRLRRILRSVAIPAPATRKALWTSKNVPRPLVFNDFDFQIDHARRRSTNFAELNFQKRTEHAAWGIFFAEIALARRHGANWYAQLPKVLQTHGILTILISQSLSRAGLVQILSISWADDPPQLSFFGPDFGNPRNHEIMGKHSISAIPNRQFLSRLTSMLLDLPTTVSIVGR